MLWPKANVANSALFSDGAVATGMPLSSRQKRTLCHCGDKLIELSRKITYSFALIKCRRWVMTAKIVAGEGRERQKVPMQILEWSDPQWPWTADAEWFSCDGVDAIVKNANVPKGSFYYYFKVKRIMLRPFWTPMTVSSSITQKTSTWIILHTNGTSGKFHNDACEGIKKYNFTRGCLVGKWCRRVRGFPNPSLKYYRIFWELAGTCCGLPVRRVIFRRNSSNMNNTQLAAIFWSGWEGA